jgi:hypothetical protein
MYFSDILLEICNTDTFESRQQPQYLCIGMQSIVRVTNAYCIPPMCDEGSPPTNKYKNFTLFFL